MKSIVEYLNIEKIDEAFVEKSAINVIKALKDAMDNAIKVYVANHKPTDTVRDYIDSISKTLEAGLMVSLSKTFSVDKIKELVNIFSESVNKEIKKKGFKENALFDEFWKNR